MAQTEGPAFLFRRLPGGGVELACYRESFAIKDVLKARGYRFGQVPTPDRSQDVVAIARQRPVPGWSVKFEGAQEFVVDHAELEVMWIRSRGFSLVKQSGAPLTEECE